MVVVMVIVIVGGAKKGTKVKAKEQRGVTSTNTYSRSAMCDGMA
jgi:hypothetical protein